MEQNKRKKIVIGINDFELAGAQRLIVDFLRNVDGVQYEYVLVVLRSLTNRADIYEQIPEHIKVIRFSFRGFFDVKSWREVWRCLKEVQPDLVWSHMYFSNTVFRILKPLCGYAVIINEHNTYTWKSFKQKLIDHVLSYGTSSIVAVSQTVADFTSKQEWIARSKFFVIENGIDIETIQERAQNTDAAMLRRELGIGEGKRLIVNVARFVRQKNQLLLIDAFAQFTRKHHNFQLVLVGDGPMRPFLKKRVEQHCLGKQVLFLGARTDVAEINSLAEYFVLPSHIEGFGIAAIEAMACGLPVISTRTAGPDQYIKDGVNGYLAESSPEDLSEKMRLVAAADGEERDSLSKGARETAAQYDIKKTARSYESLFESALR